MNDATTLELLERLRGRFFGKYRGVVTDIDTDFPGRIKAKVPAVLGEQKTGWAMPCVPYAGDGVGFAFLPEVGAGVWIEFEGGDVSYPIWTGCYWRRGEPPSAMAAAVKVLRTKSGHEITLDDDAGSVTVKDGNGNQVTLDSNGIKLERGAGSLEITDSKLSANGGALEVT
jgi:uncharacterized protein involved in type VI secretion and phage assembly